MHARVSEGDFILPMMRDAMQTIIGANTHLTERCEAMLEALNGPLAAPLEPTEAELNPPPPPKKEYVITLGTTVFLGAQEYEVLAYDDKEVRLYDLEFPLFNKEMSREEFEQMLAENPQNDHLLQVVAEAPEVTEQPETAADLDSAKALINEYCMEVFESEADFTDLSHVDLAFSSTSDSGHSVEIYADLVGFRLVYQVDGAEVTSIQCAGFRDLNEFLANLDFDEMVAFAEEEYKKQPEQSAVEPSERFHVVELDRGSQIAYGIWDDLNDRIYVDDEGVSEEFTSEWQAENYADRLNGKTPPQTEREPVDAVARYRSYGEIILIRQYPNGQYHVHYCYDYDEGSPYATAGGFDTFEEAEDTLYSHRPQAEKIAEVESEQPDRPENRIDEMLRHTNPHFIELMPGLIGKSIRRFGAGHIPIIAGGLIETKAEVMDALSCGATAVSTGRKDLWYI